MKSAMECESLAEIREGIDAIDAEMVGLLAARAAYVREAAKFKKSEDGVRDPERVKKVIESKKQLARQAGAPEALTEKIYALMIDWFVNAEMEEWKKG